MAELVLLVEFKRDPKNLRRCFTESSFVAERGSKVEFRFWEVPDAQIEFIGGSPFEPPDVAKFEIGSTGIWKKVRDDAPFESYAYTVKWGKGADEGMGRGGGVVRGSGQ